MACRSMLRKLEQRQFIVLPAALRSGNRARRIRDIAHSCDPIEFALEHLCPIEIVMVTGRGDTDDLFHCLMDRYHYLGCRGHVGETHQVHGLRLPQTTAGLPAFRLGGLENGR